MKTNTLPIHQLSLYNTGRMTPEQIIAAFAVRGPVFGRIMDDLKAETPESRAQHHLIVGQRGMGKTMLLHRVAAELKIQPDLAEQFVPLVFAEEQYSVDRLSKFWLNCLDSLADAWEKAARQEEADEVDRVVGGLKSSQSRSVAEDGPVAERALNALLDLVKPTGQRPVLLVDNLQLVFERLEKAQQHSLRELLMRPGSPILIGASPSPPQESQDYGAPFYDHFKTHYLRPLDVGEMKELLLNLADVSGRPDVRGHVLDHPERLEVLRQLTGGNPRTTGALFFLYAEDFAPSVFGDLENLLDRVTPLYKARFEELTSQQQVIAGSVAGFWSPVTAAKIAEDTSLPAGTISSQLDRLEKVGFIEKVSLFGEARSGYQLAERFFNIWFLMRSASRRQRREVEFLTRFIESFYEAPDRRRLANSLMEESYFSGDRYQLSMAVAASLDHPETAGDLMRHTDLCLLRQRAEKDRAKLAEIIDFGSLPPAALEFHQLREKLAHLVPAHVGISGDYFANQVLGDRTLFKTGRRESIATRKDRLSQQEIEALLASVTSSRVADVGTYREEAVAWFEDRLRSGQLASGTNIDDWERAFGQAQDREVLRLMIDTLPSGTGAKLGRVTLDKISGAFEPRRDESAAKWFGWAYALHALLQRYNEAENAYRQALAKNPLEVATWNNFGNLLRDHLKRFDEAEQAFRKAINIDPKAATPWINLGNLLFSPLQRFAEAESAYRKAIILAPKNATAWSNLGTLLWQFPNRRDETEAVCRHTIELDPRNSAGWNGLGNILANHHKQYESAEEAYHKAIEYNPEDAVPWNGLGALFHDLHNNIEAEKAYREGIRRNPSFGQTWYNLGNLLQETERYVEAENAYREAIACDPNPAKPWNNLGNLLAKHLGRPEEAEVAYRKAIALKPNNAIYYINLGGLIETFFQRHEEAEASFRKAIELDPNNWQPWLNLGILLDAAFHRYEEAEEAYRRANALDAQGGAAWLNLGNLLQLHLHRYEEAERAYREAIKYNPANSLAWINLGMLLASHLQRYDEAESAYLEAIRLDADDPNPWNCLGNLYQDNFHRFDAAAKAYGEALRRNPAHEAAHHNSLFLHRDCLGEGSGTREMLNPLRGFQSSEFPESLDLQEALFASYDDNWGLVCESLAKALDQLENGFRPNTTDDWMRSSAVLLHLNDGEKLLRFLESRGDDARMRPWYEALRAHVVGDRRMLQNVAPEVRTLAEKFFDEIECRLVHLPAKTSRRPVVRVKQKKKL